MHREDGFVAIGHPFNQFLDQVTKLGGQAITYGIGDIDRGRTGLDHRLQHPAQKIDLRAAGILG
jgi:hypothetical protein